MTAFVARRSARLANLSLSSNADDNNSSVLAPSSDRYSSLKASELRDLLRRRGLAVSGVKSTLVERLASPALADEPLAATTDNDAVDDGTHAQPRARASKRARKDSASRRVPRSSALDADATPAPVQVVRCGTDCLPRTREIQLQSRADMTIIGVDEAGRGPLAGPVVAVAAIVPENIPGIIDSKKITKEDEREKLYEQIVASPGVRYAVSVVGAPRIDEINILQATLEGMRMAVEGVMNASRGGEDGGKGERGGLATAGRADVSYTVTGGCSISLGEENGNGNGYYALIDGNKVPERMPCPCESLTKGDGREYSIGAASIIAKVTRDRLMHEYDKMYPDYNLSQHKGYPTAAHMNAVRKFGASPIHRRTFAPLKHMEFDEDGKVIG